MVESFFWGPRLPFAHFYVKTIKDNLQDNKMMNFEIYTDLSFLLRSPRHFDHFILSVKMIYLKITILSYLSKIAFLEEALSDLLIFT